MTTTAGSVDLTPPVLVLGVGNTLLSDDGVGLVLLDLLEHAQSWPGQVEFVDGGTQGIALLGRLAGRRSVLVLDAVQLGAEPGTIHELSLDQLRRFGPRQTATPHENNVSQLLATAELTGELPAHAAVIGIEPFTLKTGYGISNKVQRSLPAAVELARERLTALLET